MKPEREADRNTGTQTRNPFGVMDVPEPNDQAVMQFAGTATLDGASGDANAAAWADTPSEYGHGTIDGDWSSRWNGAADPTIPGDAADKWKTGRGQTRSADDRVYLYFEWNAGARKGLIEARRDGTHLVGKYINLSSPAITRPWIGLIVDNSRIDGRFPEGRLDFRR